ncbi:hypothetical protein H5410_060873 [Solanum commersonii]|uniref:Uncharacterized protein n=1 Tax=Solanum commersonii TaxID=4109 RepID=A0A9J5W670_SOLCO|nr:hypothetical protein H5410_060873 [Solanum commersonii]
MALNATATTRVREDILQSLHMSKATKIVLILPRVLITSCRKQRRNFIALASSIQTILKYIVIQESKTKSINIDINFLDESTKFIGLAIL